MTAPACRHGTDASGRCRVFHGCYDLAARRLAPAVVLAVHVSLDNARREPTAVVTSCPCCADTGGHAALRASTEVGGRWECAVGGHHGQRGGVPGLALALSGGDTRRAAAALAHLLHGDPAPADLHRRTLPVLADARSSRNATAVLPAPSPPDADARSSRNATAVLPAPSPPDAEPEPRSVYRLGAPVWRPVDPSAHPYWSRLALSPFVASRFCVGLDRADRACVPLHDADGRREGVAVRRGPGKWFLPPGYPKRSRLWGLHIARAALAAGAVPVVVEGVGDALVVAEAGRLPLALLGWPAPEQVALLAAVAQGPVVGLLDGDDTGRRLAALLRAILGDRLVLVALPEGHDPADVGPDRLRAQLADETTTAGAPGAGSSPPPRSAPRSPRRGRATPLS